MEHVKKRWRNIKDYEKSKKKPAQKREKKTTGKGRTSDDDENVSHGDDDEDDDEDAKSDGSVEEETSFLNECITQRNTKSNIFDDDSGPKASSTQENRDQLVEIEIVPTYADSLTGMIISEKGDTVHSECNENDAFEMESSSVPSRSLFPFASKADKRRKPPKDDAFVVAMREKTQAFKELAQTSSALNEVYTNRENVERSITQKYFDVYAADIALLPVELQTKCQREVQQAVSAIIYKFQDQAEEMLKAAK